MSLRSYALFSLISLMMSCGREKPKEGKVALAFKKEIDTIAGDTVQEMGRSVRGILEDAQHNFWFATDGQGVYKYDGKTLLQYRDKVGLCNNYVWSLYQDRAGKIWFRTRDDLCNYNGSLFTKQKPLPLNQSVPYDPKAHDLFLDHYYDGKNLMRIQLPETSPLKKIHERHYDIYSSYKDRKGHVWFGTLTAGVCKFDGKKYTWFNDPELGAPVRTFFEDSKGHLWIGNNGYGLFRYDGKNLVNMTKKFRLENREFLTTHESKKGTLARVWAIGEDTQGKIWIGTIDTNIWVFDGEKLINFTNRGRIGTDAIWTIYRDRKDRLWFGTDGAGAYTLNGKTFVKFKQ